MIDPSCTYGEWGVTFVKNGTKLGGAGASVSMIEYGRVLDAPSQATVEIITAGDDCCGQLAAVDHYNTDMLITCVNPLTEQHEVMWRGPVTKPEFFRGRMTVVAKDVLHWLEVRLLEQAFNFVTKDVSDIFVDLATYALTKDPNNTPVYEMVVTSSGTSESRVIDPLAGRMTWSVMQEMLDAGLDVTTFGSNILVGIPAFTTLDLRDTDVLGDVSIAKAGEDFTNRVVANASRDITGVYPPGPAAGSGGYPLVETKLDDTQLTDAAGALAAAKAKYDFSAGGARRVHADGGLQLLPGSKIDYKRLLAGQLFNFTATEACYSATETLRLGRLTTRVDDKGVTNTIELQPAGNLQGGGTLASSV